MEGAKRWGEAERNAKERKVWLPDHTPWLTHKDIKKGGATAPPNDLPGD
jgi:hypothetical protein